MLVKILWIITGLITLAFIPCFYLSYKFRNPHKLFFCFGKKGAGKSTMLTMLAYKYNQKGIKCYCNTEIPGTYLFDPKDIGFYRFEPNSVIFIDEVSLIWDNRNFKNFKPEVGKFFRLQRHYKLTVWLFSQTFDVDKKIRDQTDKMYMLFNPFGWFTYCTEIKRRLKVVEPTENTEARITDTLEIPKWWTALFGSRKFIFIPRWAKYFDSHIIEDVLPDVDCVYQPYKDENKLLHCNKIRAIMASLKQGGANHGKKDVLDQAGSGETGDFKESV